MFATGCVEAAIRSNEALYRLPTENMRLDYFIDIFCSNPAVPNPVWIYNDIRSMFALVKAAGFVGPDFVLEAACREFLLENPLQFACSARIATSSGMAGRALICPHAEAGMDVDKPRQYDLLKRDLEARRSGA